MRLFARLLFLQSSWLDALGLQATDHDSSPLTIDAEEVIRIRASTDERQSTVVQWEGQALFVKSMRAEEVRQQADRVNRIYKPGQRPQVAFNVLGMNVARAKRLDDGSYDILSRELQLYLDPTTSEILHQWKNPFTNESVDVIHVQNAPVYQTVPASTIYTPRNLPNDYSTFTLTIPLAYPNPLNPSNSPTSPFGPYQGAFQALYSAIESFTFTFSQRELSSSRLSSIPSTQVYWTRTSPLLPWMNSPDTNATLVFVANGSKVTGGWRGLHPVLKRVIEETLPSYKEAPWVRERPGGGVTSWSFFTQPGVLEMWRNGTVFPIAEG